MCEDFTLSLVCAVGSFTTLERYNNILFTLFNEAKRCDSLAKSVTSVYMNRDILRWIDEKVKEHVYRNRSHAVEYAIVQLMMRDRSPRRDY